MLWTYRYRVERGDLPPFIILIKAGDGRAATMMAAEIGKTLEVLLVGPL